ncbi:MAG: putative transposase [Saprospiraceae bacterium]|jgi:putative transposase
MSNHVHLICKADHDNLSDVIRDFKKHTSKKIIQSIKDQPESRRSWLLWMFEREAKKAGRIGFKLWKAGTGAEQLISNQFIDQKSNYIHENPVRAGIVRSSDEYVYSSMNEDSLVTIEDI